MQDSKSRTRLSCRLLGPLALAVATVLAAGPVAATCASLLVEYEWIDIPGDPANPNPPDLSALDPDTLLPMGSVSLPFRIAKREVSNADYLVFLNAQARPTDPNDLFTDYMNRNAQGIESEETDTEVLLYRYKNKGGFAQIADRPVGNVTYYDAMRFANWFHKGCPEFPDYNANNVNLNTDRGAYTITPSLVADNAVPRNPDALAFLLTADEWHKAAYYDEATQSYFRYPTSSDTSPACLNPAVATANSASCARSYVSLQPKAGFNVPPPAGSYPDSMSPYGVLDMAGSINEWTQANRYSFFKVLRGGSYVSLSSEDSAAIDPGMPFLPTAEFNDIGFRLGAPAAPSGPAQPPVDTDQDGILDSEDNCTLHPNPAQLDSNGDGYGNRCDADYDDDGHIGGLDFTKFVAGFLSEVGESTYDHAVDCDGDGQIGGPDFNCFVLGFRAGVPGPSGTP